MRNLTVLAAVLCLGITAGAHAAVSFGTAEPAARPFHVGKLSVTALHDAQIIVANDGKTFGLGVSPRRVAKVLSAAGAPADRITLSTVAPRIQTFEPGEQIAPGIRSVSLPGHTPGHVGYEIASGHARLMDMGDVAHSSIVSLARPQWPIGFDADHALAGATREKTLTTLARSGEWVFAPHFPFPGVGHVVAAGRGFAWKPGLP